MGDNFPPASATWWEDHSLHSSIRHFTQMSRLLHMQVNNLYALRWDRPRCVYGNTRKIDGNIEASDRTESSHDPAQTSRDRTAASPAHARYERRRHACSCVVRSSCVSYHSRQQKGVGGIRYVDKTAYNKSYSAMISNHRKRNIPPSGVLVVL